MVGITSIPFSFPLLIYRAIPPKQQTEYRIKLTFNKHVNEIACGIIQIRNQKRTGQVCLFVVSPKRLQIGNKYSQYGKTSKNIQKNLFHEKVQVQSYSF